MHTRYCLQVSKFPTPSNKMSAAFRSILHMTAEEAKEFCATNNLTPFAVYEEPARLIVPDTMKSTPNRAELEYYLGINDVYRVGKATIYRDGIQVADVKPIPNFRPILDMTVEEAKEFCTTNKFKPCIVYMEPSATTTYSDKSVRDRVELTFYLDATDTHRVGKAIVYQDFIQVAVIKPDECDECGGECDGVHAAVFSVRTLLDMTEAEAKKYCNSCKVPIIYNYPETKLRRIPNMELTSWVELFLRGDRVYAADYYSNKTLVDSLRGDYLAPSNVVNVKDAVKDAAKEKRVKELTDTILKNEKSIVDEVVRQMDAKRVSRIMDVLSVQDPDVVTEVVAKLKGVSHSTYNSAEDMRQLWKSYGK